MLGDAAIDQAGPQAGVAAIGAEAFGDLPGQLTSRREDEGSAAIAWRADRVGEQTMQDRQREGGGLAGAGLGNALHVTTFEDGWDRLRLDRRCGGVAFLSNGVENGRRETERVETGTHAERSLSGGCGDRRDHEPARQAMCGEPERPKSRTGPADRCTQAGARRGSRRKAQRVSDESAAGSQAFRRLCLTWAGPARKSSLCRSSMR